MTTYSTKHLTRVFLLKYSLHKLPRHLTIKLSCWFALANHEAICKNLVERPGQWEGVIGSSYGGRELSICWSIRHQGQNRPHSFVKATTAVIKKWYVLLFHRAYGLSIRVLCIAVVIVVSVTSTSYLPYCSYNPFPCLLKTKLSLHLPLWIIAVRAVSFVCVYLAP